ncbi:MAG: hypothetical protein AAF628_29575 [Planctomycetota bacterium]
MPHLRFSPTTVLGLLGLLGIAGTLGGGTALSMGAFHQPQLRYDLEQSTGEFGNAEATIDGTQLSIRVTGADPNTLYTVWVDFRSRATLTVSADYPPGALARGVAPAFASTAGVTSGIGMDPNGFVTDGSGNALFTVALDYELLKAGDAPVVWDALAMQGANRVGGQWMRRYQGDSGASLQRVDPTTGLPLLARATPQGLTLVKHPDRVTHGHTPGVGGVDHNPGFKGDFPLR